MKIIDQTVTPEFALYHGDCVQVLAGLPEASVHYSVFSPPFATLYSYTDATEDMSNVRDYEEFFAGFHFMIEGLARVMMAGRLVSFHCMNLPCTIEHHGFIGVQDFRGDLIRAFQKHGFIYHSEVVIWKDPLVAATRTHALGLAHQQIVKDSAMCRQGIPDYLVTMRKPGKNPEPVTHPAGFDRWIGPPELEPKAMKRADPGKNKYSHYVWQNYASPVWMDIDPGDTLQKKSARDDNDSRHICPLQKTVIRRAIELWTNPGDIVLSPYAGIGTEGYVAIQEGRRFVGAELKDTYYRQAKANLANAKGSKAQMTIEDAMEQQELTEEAPCETPIERKILETARDSECSPLDVVNQRSVSLGAVYVSMSKLEDAGLICTRLEPGGPERGGRNKMIISITVAGKEALEAPCE